jgi:hypothetical protein
MAVKAQLRVQLLANDVVIAESESSELWQSVLRAIERDRPLDEDGHGEIGEVAAVKPRESERPANDGLQQLARELRVERAVIEGACAPSAEAPYIHLDKHHWEALRRNTPERGVLAISPVVLAATLLVLWWRCAGKSGVPSVSDVKPVLDTLHLPAFNVNRSLENCRWLQVRGKSVALNPSRTSSAIAVARAYCLQQAVEREVE